MFPRYCFAAVFVDKETATEKSSHVRIKLEVNDSLLNKPVSQCPITEYPVNIAYNTISARPVGLIISYQFEPYCHI